MKPAGWGRATTHTPASRAAQASKVTHALRKLELWAEIDRLEAEAERTASKLTKALLPAILFACVGPLVLDLPISVWVLASSILTVLGPGILFIVDAGVRNSQKRWNRIQRLKREVRLLEALGDLTEDERAVLDLS